MAVGCVSGYKKISFCFCLSFLLLWIGIITTVVKNAVKFAIFYFVCLWNTEDEVKSYSNVSCHFKFDLKASQRFSFDSKVSQCFSFDSKVSQCFNFDSKVNQRFIFDSKMSQRFKFESKVSQFFKTKLFSKK